MKVSSIYKYIRKREKLPSHLVVSEDPSSLEPDPIVTRPPPRNVATNTDFNRPEVSRSPTEASAPVTSAAPAPSTFQAQATCKSSTVQNPSLGEGNTDVAETMREAMIMAFEDIAAKLRSNTSKFQNILKV